MRPDLVITYQHDPVTAAPLYAGYAVAEAVAQDLRRQLGYDSDALVLDVERLTSVTAAWVNGIGYEFEWSTGNPVTAEDGSPALGLCEFSPDLPDCAQVSVNPEIVGDLEELLRSTAFHETGHGLFEAPAWIHAYRRCSAPSLFDHGDSEATRRACRTITPDEAHLSATPPPGSPEFFQETRANEFMGSALAPRASLRRRFLTHCETVELDPGLVGSASRAPLFMPGTSAEPTSNSGNLNGLRIDVEQRLRQVVKLIAREYKLTRRFIEVRLKRYGLLHQAAQVR